MVSRQPDSGLMELLGNFKRYSQHVSGISKRLAAVGIITLKSFDFSNALPRNSSPNLNIDPIQLITFKILQPGLSKKRVAASC